MKTRNHQQNDLRAEDFYEGDDVIGEADGEVATGVVYARSPSAGVDDVSVRWDDEDYVGSHKAHLVSAKLLRLWPARAHAARVGKVWGLS